MHCLTICFCSVRGASMKALRRLLAITLLVMLGLPLASPLFAITAKSGNGLPACCRQGGKHHCMSDLTELPEGASVSREFRAPVDRCPYSPGLTSAVRPSQAILSTGDAIYAGLISHPAVVAQTQSKWRIARDRSRLKRGPPSPLL